VNAQEQLDQQQQQHQRISRQEQSEWLLQVCDACPLPCKPAGPDSLTILVLQTELSTKPTCNK
jgi:hypothetical protein